MNALEKLNKYTYGIDGDLTEFTPWHCAALKAAIAIENNAPCSEDCLFDALELSCKLFGSSKTQVQFGSTVIDKNNDQIITLLHQYNLVTGFDKLKNRWTCGFWGDSYGHVEFTHGNDCRHICIAECIAALPEHLLDI